MSEGRRSTLDARVAELERAGYVIRARRPDEWAVLARGDELVLVKASGRVLQIEGPYWALLVACAEGTP